MDIQGRWCKVVLMLGQRRRRWPNIKTTFDQCVVCTGASWKKQLQKKSMYWDQVDGTFWDLITVRMWWIAAEIGSGRLTGFRYMAVIRLNLAE